MGALALLSSPGLVPLRTVKVGYWTVYHFRNWKPVVPSPFLETNGAYPFVGQPLTQTATVKLLVMSRSKVTAYPVSVLALLVIATAQLPRLRSSAYWPTKPGRLVGVSCTQA